MEVSIFKYPALIGFLVKRLNKKYPGKQIGKTVVQKLMYLLTRNGIADFKYSMYHYGPYSAQVSYELGSARDSSIVTINWVDNKGYFIKPGPNLARFESLVNDDERRAIDDLVKEFGEFNAIELSIIATALFLEDNFNVPKERLVSAMQRAKPNYEEESIINTLRKGKII